MAQVFGSANGNAHLTEQDAREIYILANGGTMTLREIARTYGVSHSIVHGIKSKQIWPHIHDEELTTEEN
jgi:DNA invertase Pin-like site-specific DNA recombinase